MVVLEMAKWMKMRDNEEIGKRTFLPKIFQVDVSTNTRMLHKLIFEHVKPLMIQWKKRSVDGSLNKDGKRTKYCYGEDVSFEACFPEF